MNLEQIKEKLDEICQMDGIGINIYFLLSINGQQELRRADIIEDVKTDLLNSYKNTLRGIVANEELGLLNLSAADDRINAFYKYDLDEKPAFFGFFDTIYNNSQNVQTFSFTNDSLNTLEGYFIHIGDHGTNLILYRKQMSVNLFKQGKIYLVKGHETQFEKINQEFLRIDTKVDVINLDNINYINNISILERHYEFNTIIINEATQSITSISTLDILENIDILSSRVSDVRFARKLSKISTISPVFQLPKEQIMSFVKGHLTLGVQFRFSTDGSKILLDTKKSQDFFIRLMNDDFLHSELTNFDYVTPAKDKLD